MNHTNLDVKTQLKSRMNTFKFVFWVHSSPFLNCLGSIIKRNGLVSSQDQSIIGNKRKRCPHTWTKTGEKVTTMSWNFRERNPLPRKVLKDWKSWTSWVEDTDTHSDPKTLSIPLWIVNDGVEGLKMGVRVKNIGGEDLM